MADIFEQVDEALREDRMKSMWRRFGWMIIAGAILIVAGTAAVVGWRAYERSAAEERTAALAGAFDAAADAEPSEAVAALTSFAQDAEPGFAALARLQAAARAVGADDRPTAVALYQQVADSPDVDPALRELATILGTSLSVGTLDLDAVRGRLAAMDASNSPWRHLAGEIIAAAALEAGDVALARERLTAIADDAEAPIGMRGRAAELLAAIGPDPGVAAAPDDAASDDAASDDAASGEAEDPVLEEAAQ